MAENCCRGNHGAHMCQLVQNKVSMEELKRTVGEPKYICVTCGRAAENEENLCVPEKLK